MKELVLQESHTHGKHFSMDSREVPMVGVVNEVHFRFVGFLEKNYDMSVIVVDILAQYGMLLSRGWAVVVWGSMMVKLSYATIPMNSRDVMLVREKRAQHTIEYFYQHENVHFIDIDMDNFKVANTEPMKVKDAQTIEEIHIFS